MATLFVHRSASSSFFRLPFCSQLANVSCQRLSLAPTLKCTRFRSTHMKCTHSAKQLHYSVRGVSRSAHYHLLFNLHIHTFGKRAHTLLVTQPANHFATSSFGATDLAEAQWIQLVPFTVYIVPLNWLNWIAHLHTNVHCFGHRLCGTESGTFTLLFGRFW